jgi:phytanoyl-CoA hydroxylase
VVQPKLDEYSKAGYTIARGVVDSDVVGQARRHAEWTIDSNRDLTSEQLHQKMLWTDDPFYLYLIRQPGLVDLAQQLIGPDLAVFATAYIVKEPGNSPAVLWHQDGSYWPLEPMEVCTLWLAITSSSPENGCMRVIPGTHTMDLQQLENRTDTRNLLDSSLNENLIDESQAVDLVLAPGDASVHHPNIVHGSAPNNSLDTWRLNLVARVISATTRVTDGSWPGVYYLSGEKRDDINTYLPTPPWDESKHLRFPGCDTA